MGDVVTQGLKLISDKAPLLSLLLRLSLPCGCLEPFVRGKRVSQEGPQLGDSIGYI